MTRYFLALLAILFVSLGILSPASAKDMAAINSCKIDKLHDLNLTEPQAAHLKFGYSFTIGVQRFVLDHKPVNGVRIRYIWDACRVYVQTAGIVPALRPSISATVPKPAVVQKPATVKPAPIKQHVQPPVAQSVPRPATPITPKLATPAPAKTPALQVVAPAQSASVPVAATAPIPPVQPKAYETLEGIPALTGNPGALVSRPFGARNPGVFATPMKSAAAPTQPFEHRAFAPAPAAKPGLFARVERKIGQRPYLLLLLAGFALVMSLGLSLFWLNIRSRREPDEIVPTPQMTVSVPVVPETKSQQTGEPAPQPPVTPRAREPAHVNTGEENPLLRLQATREALEAEPGLVGDESDLEGAMAALARERVDRTPVLEAVRKAS